jgi:drug/metabolite transporter (DMT)-like permease
MRIAAPEMGPLWLIEFRVLVAGLVLLPVLARAGKLGELRRFWKPLLILGIINSAVPFVLLAYATVSLPAGLTSILNATAPLFGIVVAFFWLDERLSWARGAALFLLPAVPFSAPASSPSLTVLLVALALAVLSTAVAYILYFHLIQTAGSSKALTVTYLVPLFAMIWAFVFLTEPITPAMIVGCTLILSGTAVANEIFASRFRKSQVVP